MVKIIIIVTLFLVVMIIPVTLFADMGIGGVAGYGRPTGVTVKIDNFPVVSLGWSLSTNVIEGTVDYWFLNNKIDRNILWYLGAGVQLSVGNNFGLGFRVPVGIQWYFMPSFELFGELAPGFTILPASGFSVSGGIGLRYHF